MLKLEEIVAIVKEIKFLDWKFFIMEKGDGFLLQIKFFAADSTQPGAEPVLQSCRKWYISSHSVKAEVVRTAWKAVEAAVLHEAQEEFKYRGVAIFNPHLDPDDQIRDRRLSTRPAQKPTGLRANGPRMEHVTRRQDRRKNYSRTSTA